MISIETCCISPAGKNLGNIASFLSQHLVFLPSRDSLALQKRQQNPKNFPPCRAGKSMCSSGEQVHDKKPCTCSSRPHPHPLHTGYPLMWYLHDFEFFDDLCPPRGAGLGKISEIPKFSAAFGRKIFDVRNKLIMIVIMID